MRRGVWGVVWFGVWCGVGAVALAQSTSATDTRQSGYRVMSRTTQALQDDDTQNPAMLWVSDGEVQWSTPPAAGTKSCADCHGTIARMRGVATRYPQHSTRLSRIVNLGQQINQCRTTQQSQMAWPAEHAALLGLEAAIAKQSRGLAVAPPAQPELVAAQARGEARYKQRIGQMDLSCRDCHDALAGKRLGGTVIPQGHPTGYPIYRLEWQGVGSLQRRLRNCITAVRADASSFSADELLDLEAYLMRRARGMPLETPAVRP